LVILDKWINQQQKREFIYQHRLIPLLKQYEVIVFDNGPSWNHLIENALICTDAIICPLGCNLLAYNASETNLCTIFDFQELMNLKNQKLIMLATLLERSSLSQQIYAKYVTKFSNYLIPIPIRHSTKIQEALIQKQSILEGSPNSQIAQDYYDLVQSLWDKINN
jgi:chromosome partitioning protein